MKTMNRRELIRRAMPGTGTPGGTDAAVGVETRSQPASAAGLSEEEAKQLADRILAMSGADETEVRLRSGRQSNTRYAVNRVTTAGDADDVTAVITARFGQRAGSVTTNKLDDQSLSEAVESAEELARLAPENDERMPLLGPQTYLETRGYFDSTAELNAERRAEVAASAIGAASETGGLAAAGFLECSAGSTAIANSAGLFAFHASTDFDYSVTVRTTDGSGSGWAGTGGRDWAEVDFDGIHRRAIQKAVRSRDPQPLEPGTYPVVLEPRAVSDLIGLLAFSLNARTADEGRSAFSAKGGGTRIGEQIVDSRVTLLSDPAEMGAAPFVGGGGFGFGGGFGGGFASDDSGLPLGRQAWVEDGVLKSLFQSRYWAKKQGLKPVAFPSTLIMQGDDQSLEDLIASTERAVLVTRLWYIRAIDPRTVSYTGLTRDGNFMIEDGRISHPVNNFRWNDSPLAVLSNLEAMSRPERISASRNMPAIRSSAFTFSSVSEAV
ncbi:MAG: TldD/PmbA family protein [Gemmatimonadales bacterium]|jgi:predicted Zn-dependent protease